MKAGTALQRMYAAVRTYTIFRWARVLACAAIVFLLLPISPIAKLVLVVPVLLVCPGITVLGYLGETEILRMLAIAPGISVALLVIVAESMALLGWWMPRGAFTVLLSCVVIFGEPFGFSLRSRHAENVLGRLHRSLNSRTARRG